MIHGVSDVTIFSNNDKFVEACKDLNIDIEEQDLSYYEDFERTGIWVEAFWNGKKYVPANGN